MNIYQVPKGNETVVLKPPSLEPIFILRMKWVAGMKLSFRIWRFILTSFYETNKQKTQNMKIWSLLEKLFYIHKSY